MTILFILYIHGQVTVYEISKVSSLVDTGQALLEPPSRSHADPSHGIAGCP